MNSWRSIGPLQGSWPAKALALLGAGLSLCACGGAPEAEVAVAVLAPSTLAFSVEAEGQLKAAKAVPLRVPGQQWAQRQLIWMKDDGSPVAAGEVVARFSAAAGELELDKALLDLQRNALARAGKQDELAASKERVGVDLAQVGTELAIARRYARADLAMLARNDILDAIQDENFLGAKQGVLEWLSDRAGERGTAELAVLDAQKASFDLNASARRDDLAALELRAPQAGVLVLASNWSGEKPQLGSSMWAGMEFATLPDPAAMEVELSLPQQEAQGLQAGLAVELHPLGRPEQRVASRLTWVAIAGQLKERGNPIKYLSMKASLPAAAATTYAWVPGQAIHARIVVHRAQAALSVPNVAILAEGEHRYLMVREGTSWQRREIKLGARGPARSEVVDGVRSGEVVHLLPESAG